MAKKKIENPFQNQLKTLQEVIKHIRYHANMLYIDERTIYCDSFLDFEKVLCILRPNVELFAYNGIYGYVGDMYDAINKMRKTRLSVSRYYDPVQRAECIEMWDMTAESRITLNTMETINKTSDKKRTAFLTDLYGDYLKIFADEIGKSFMSFPEDGIKAISDGLSYDLVVDGSERVLTLAKEALPLLDGRNLSYRYCKDYSSDDFFITMLNKSDAIMDMYILVEAFVIPD